MHVKVKGIHRDENISEVKNSTGGINSRLNTDKEKISDMKYMAVKTIQNESERGKP